MYRVLVWGFSLEVLRTGIIAGYYKLLLKIVECRVIELWRNILRYICVTLDIIDVVELDILLFEMKIVMFYEGGKVLKNVCL